MVSTRTEHLLVTLILVAFFILQINAIIHGGVIGQDFEYYHKASVFKAANDPIQWVFGSLARSSPPIYHLIIAQIYLLVGPNAWLFFTGLFNSLTNIAALVIYYYICSQMISSAMLRITALITVAFLPVVQITSIVLATDAVSQLPVLAIVLVFALLAKDQIKLTLGLIVITVATLIGVSTKYLAISLIGAVPVSFFVLWYVKKITLRAFLFCCSVFTILTAALAVYWISQRTENITDHFSPKMGGMAKPPGRINARSLLFFRSGDIYLLSAPASSDLLSPDKTAKASLFNSNYFSYPGLVCLGTFTDSLNIVHRSGRARVAQRLMELSMKTGVISAVLGLICAFGTSLISLKRVFRDRDINYATPLITTVVAGCWLVFMMGIMTRATMAYPYGYWLPRLIVPSIMLAVALAFTGLDILGGPIRKPFLVFLCGLAIFQSAVHIGVLL